MSPHLSLAPDKVATAKGTSKLLLGTGSTLFVGKTLSKITKKAQKNVLPKKKKTTNNTKKTSVELKRINREIKNNQFLIRTEKASKNPRKTLIAKIQKENKQLRAKRKKLTQ